MTIIIDTDPGIDDAIALLYALRSGQDIVAITTVAGNLGLSVTTGNAARVLAVAGRDLPIHAGADAPLHGDAKPEIGIHGDDGLGGVAFPEPATPSSTIGAVDAMIDLVNTHEPGAITLFCLGPLTNLAQLIDMAPDCAKRLGRVIAMGGALDEPGNAGARAEFNLAHDAHAADIVLSAGLDLTLIPLDATRQIRADADYVAALRVADRPAAAATAALIEAYFDASTSQKSRPLHDPCVPLYYSRPELFEVETRLLSVDRLTGALEAGPNEIKVAMKLDASSLRDELRRGLSL
ncbi:nucleoside hydrolase [Flavimaricola marinus]|uniref:Pyrimidine-specific ribonucleoside hydrolase RihA n=1 Tax=Flavimaricola marinus TaxID=1819565 RepID=A0A238LGS5_9RHOB|nr:nucleoside hydrolase [Flavimaricola marinus]SMY08937.1 Pyrimidine-specific ribonucleoside hydrolase RihA [Flavimaricola marinus]